MKSLKKNNDKIIDFLSEEFYDLLNSLENHVHNEKNKLMFFSPEDTAKQNLEIHKIQLLLAQYNYKITTGN